MSIAFLGQSGSDDFVARKFLMGAAIAQWIRLQPSILPPRVRLPSFYHLWSNLSCIVKRTNIKKQKEERVGPFKNENFAALVPG